MQFVSEWRKRMMLRRGGGGAAAKGAADGCVELATGEALDGPDWGLNLDICDTINSFEGQAKDVLKAIAERLQHRNSGVQNLALTLLETMMKNCRENVHCEVAQSSILQELVKIVKKKTGIQLRDRILLLLDSWQEAFGGPNSRYPQYYQAYAELKKSGIKFPKRLLDTASIFTPPIRRPARHRHRSKRDLSTKSEKLNETMAPEMGNLSLSDLVSIRRVMEILSDMLQAANPNDSMAIKDEVIVDLVGQCHFNQNKVMHLVSSTGDEELLSLGLVLNDKLHDLIAKYDAMAHFSSSIESPETPSGGSASSTSGTGSNDQIVEQIEDDEDDGFSQLAHRNSKLSPVCCQSFLTETSSTSATSKEENSSLSSKSLSLPDFSRPIMVAAKEQEILGQLSIPPVSCISSHHTPSVHSQKFNPDGCETGTSLGAETQHGPEDRRCIPYDSYIVPWAQQNLPLPLPQSQPLSLQGSSCYPPPPWEIDADDNGDASTTYEPTHVSVLPSLRPLQRHKTFALNSDGSLTSKPPQRCHSFRSTVDNSNLMLQQQRSFGSAVSGPFVSNPFHL